MTRVHEVFSQQKSHLAPKRLSPAQLAELEAIAAQAVDRSDEDEPPRESTSLPQRCHVCNAIFNTGAFKCPTPGCENHHG